METSRSQQLFERALEVIPGGVNSPVRAFGSVGGTPRFAARGSGATLTDADGTNYLDFVQSWGPLPLGHAHPEVMDAAASALASGSTFGAPHAGEVQLAERLVDAVPSLEKVRLVNSGTEASMSAVRLARGATGRDKILKFAGHYHGHVDALLVEAGSGVATLAIPGTPGVTAGAAADTLVAPWNDLAALDAVLDEHGDGLAAIILEPVAANMNLIPADPGFLAAVRDRCTARGIVLIFDEVITGFRLGRAGAQGRFGVTPDLTVLGKAIGGGFPLAAFGGSAALMDQLAPLGPVYQAGTLSGNPVAVAAGIAQVDLLTDDVYTQIEAVTARVVASLRAAFSDAGLAATVTQEGTLSGFVFAGQAPRNYDEVRQADHARYGRFFHEMLARGVYLAPSGYEVLFTSTAHDDDALERFAQASLEAARAVASA
ncbi:MAG: glutamate-1-semialdehyde 2,1-aminomutase [Glaciecola sp.]|jgi:glutamate-1-semialdehyde 2,1-aminomutase